MAQRRCVKKRPKIKCEICGLEQPEILHKHHIVPKSEGGSNSEYNLAVLCPNCHYSVHAGKIRIIGRFDSTEGNIIIYEELTNKYTDTP